MRRRSARTRGVRASDGKRFVMIQEPKLTAQSKPLVVVLNWFVELKRLGRETDPLTMVSIETIIMVMLRVNVFEIKAKLSEYLDRAASGERIVICRHNKPVAELRAVEDVRAEPRPVGALPGRPRFDVPSSFFDPLPDEDMDLWDGGASTAADATPRHGTRPRRPSNRRRS